MLQRSRDLRDSVLASDVLDLEARDAEIVELAVGQQRKLTDGIAITHISADFRENVRHEHGELLISDRPLWSVAFVLACAVRI